MASPSDELVVPDRPGDELEPLPPTAPERPASRWRRLDKKLLAASLVIALGVVLIGYALARSVTGDEAANMPDAVEEVTPAFGAIQVPQQATVVADLRSGYVGFLTIDGIELPTIRLDEVGSQEVEPGEQVEFPPGVRYEPGNATLTFSPGSEQVIEAFAAGTHTVRVVFWRELDGRATARSYSWAFTVV